MVIIFCEHSFCSHLETKPENRFYAVWFKGCQSQVIDFLERYNYKKFRFPNFTPKTPPKWAWIGIFKLNAQNIKTCILSKLLHRFLNRCSSFDNIQVLIFWALSLKSILHNDRHHQSTLRGWSKQAYNKSKITDGRHLEQKTAISPELIDRPERNLARWCKFALESILATGS